jgi:uncharacterized delta-60 repeat protein
MPIPLGRSNKQGGHTYRSIPATRKVCLHWQVFGSLKRSKQGKTVNKLFLVGMMAMFLAAGAYAAPGDLDASFGDGKGWVSSGFESVPKSFYSRSIISQADGKLVAAGFGNYDFALVRYNSDGSLDTTFDGDGKVTTAIGASSNDYAYSVIQQADGKLVVAGDSDRDFALARYNSDGSLDTTFDGDGKVTTTIGASLDIAYSVIQQADGKLVAAGSSVLNSNDYFALVRYNSDGSLDTTFGGDGKVTTGLAGRAYSVIQQADGKLVAAGFGNYDFALVRYNSDGSLDTTFDGNGQVTTAIGASSDDYAYSVIQQADGKLVAAGSSRNSINNDDFALVRYNSDGSLDATFDGDGQVTTAIGAAWDQAKSVIQQADGKLVAAGYSYNGSNNDFALVRYNSDGSLDTTFDGDGQVTTAIGASSTDHADSIIQQADGKLVAAGSYNNDSNNYDFAVVRYNSNGSLDAAFDDDGKVTTAISTSWDQAKSVIQQADGKLVAAGSSRNGGNYDFALMRYNSDGSLDATFDGDGKVSTAIGASYDIASSVIQQGNGKLVAAGYSDNGSNNDFALVRYNSDGSLDTAFDSDGKVTTAFGASNDGAFSVIQQADGKLVVAGFSFNGSNDDFALARYHSDGSLDTTFDGDGKVTTAIGGSHDQAYSVIQQADGKLVAAGLGSIGSDDDFALVRYNSDGSLDTTFDGDGKVTTAIGSYGDRAYSVIQQADGKLVAAGYRNNGSGLDFALVRYNSDGSLDTTFDGDGKVTTAIGASWHEAYSVIQQADGKLVAAGSSQNGSYDDFALVRYHSDGSLDATFDGDGKVTTAIGQLLDEAHSVIQQADGKLVAAGFSEGMPTGQEFVLARFESGQPDTDTDGVIDGLDAFPSNASASADTDGDGKPNDCIGACTNGLVLDTDDDNDGTPDASDAFPLNASESVDTDSDGIGNNTDKDDDNDSAPDASDAFPLDASESVDTDSDGIGNNTDTDDDNDGVTDVSDNCPIYAHASQEDTDGDGIGNVCDSTPNGDTDNDGVDNLTDNCTNVSNLDQFDIDGDGIGDACDAPQLFPDDYLSDMKRDKAGTTVVFAGDVNGDRYGDYVIGIPGYNVPAAPPKKIMKNAGRADVISGKDGSVLMFANGVAQNDALGSSVAGNADIDGDGFSDVVVGSPRADNKKDGLKNTGCVVVLFGPDGLRNHTVCGQLPNSQFGFAISLADANQDGFADILIGSPKEDRSLEGWSDWKNAGSAVLFSGKDYSQITKVSNFLPGAEAGSSVLLADLDNDGVSEIIVGAPKTYWLYSSGSGDGSVGVTFSAASGVTRDTGNVSAYYLDGREFWTTEGGSRGAFLGTSLAAADIDKDGITDVIAGAPGEDYGSLKIDAGAVAVLSGENGWEITKIDGAVAKAGLGSSVAAGDVNDDGFADIIAGAAKDDKPDIKIIKDAGSVSVWSGNGYAQIGSTFYGDVSKDYFGTSVSAGDVNGDGKADLIIGIPGFDLPATPTTKIIKDAGAVKVLSGAAL